MRRPLEEGLTMRDRAQLPSAPSPDALIIRPLRRRTGLMLAGEADCTTRNRLHAALATLPVDSTGEIHLDLAELHFIDVCCVRELIAITEHRPGARLIAYCPPAVLRRITAVLGREAAIDFIETSMPGIRGS
jgi:anti-anti-sigma regulatory factor